MAGVGQEPFSRVYYGDGFKAPWLKMFRRVNSRAKQIASPLFAREEESLSAGMVGPDALAHALRIAEILTQTYGKHESYEILGSDTGKTGMHTYLRDHCEKGSPGLVLTWGEGQRVSNVGWRRNAHPFPVRLRAISATEFTPESVFGEGKIHLRLTEGGKSLILLEPDGPGSDAILCPRSE